MRKLAIAILFGIIGILLNTTVAQATVKDTAQAVDSVYYESEFSIDTVGHVLFGQVMEQGSNVMLHGAKVIFDGDTTVTNSRGQFIFYDVSNGAYRINVGYDGRWIESWLLIGGGTRVLIKLVD